MSLEQIRRAFAAPIAGPSQRALLLTLADFANDAGRECYPSQMTLAARSGLSERGVRLVMAQLITAGLVTVETPAHGNVSARYRLTLPALDADRQYVPPGTTYRKQTGPQPAKSVPLPVASAANPSEPLRNKDAGARDPQGRAPREAGSGNGAAHNAPRFALPGVSAAPLTATPEKGPGVVPGKPPQESPAERAQRIEAERKRCAAIAADELAKRKPAG